MALTEIKATKGEKTVAAAYDFGENLSDAAAKFGADVVHSGFKRTSVITAQALIRRGIEAGRSDEEIVADVAAWKPGVALTRTVDPEAKIIATFDKLSKEEQDAIIKKLKEKKK